MPLTAVAHLFGPAFAVCLVYGVFGCERPGGSIPSTWTRERLRIFGYRTESPSLWRSPRQETTVAYKDVFARGTALKLLLPGGATQLVAQINTLLAGIALPVNRSIAYAGASGKQVTSCLTLPQDYALGKRLAAMVYVYPSSTPRCPGIPICKATATKTAIRSSRMAMRCSWLPRLWWRRARAVRLMGWLQPRTERSMRP